MKVYVASLVFAPDKNSPCILTDLSDNVPMFLLNSKSGETLDIVRDSLYNISGISPNFYGHFDQAGFFEATIDQIKHIYLIYVIYFPATFDLVNQSYKWTNIGDLLEGSQLYNIIRFIYGSRQ